MHFFTIFVFIEKPNLLVYAFTLMSEEQRKKKSIQKRVSFVKKPSIIFYKQETSSSPILSSYKNEQKENIPLDMSFAEENEDILDITRDYTCNIQKRIIETVKVENIVHSTQNDNIINVQKPNIIEVSDSIQNDNEVNYNILNHPANEIITYNNGSDQDIHIIKSTEKTIISPVDIQIIAENENSRLSIRREQYEDQIRSVKFDDNSQTQIIDNTIANNHIQNEYPTTKEHHAIIENEKKQFFANNLNEIKMENLLTDLESSILIDNPILEKDLQIKKRRPALKNEDDFELSNKQNFILADEMNDTGKDYQFKINNDFAQNQVIIDRKKDVSSLDNSYNERRNMKEHVNSSQIGSYAECEINKFRHENNNNLTIQYYTQNHNEQQNINCYEKSTIFDKQAKSKEFTQNDFMGNSMNIHNYSNIKKKDTKMNDQINHNDDNLGDMTVNTVDLKKIINESVKQKEKFTLNQKLESIGVRFLDDLISKSTRKSTICTKKSEIAENLQLYYKFYIEERINFFSSFLRHMDEKMKDHDKILQEREKSLEKFDFQSIQMVKSKKQECRNKVKISWHELRKNRECIFNKNVEDKRDALLKENRKLNEELKKKLVELKSVNSQIQMIERKMEHFKNESPNVHIKTEKEFEILRNKINEQNILVNCLKKEVEEEKIRIKCKKENLEKEKREKMRLKLEIRELEEKTRIKTIDEKECDEMKKKYILHSRFFQFNAQKIGTRNIQYTFMQFDVSFDMEKFSVISNKKNGFLRFFTDKITDKKISDSHYLINYLSLVAFYHEEISSINKRCHLKIDIDEKIHLYVKIPFINDTEKKIKLIINEDLIVSVEKEENILNLGRVSLIDTIETI